jgi:hypothetical protein
MIKVELIENPDYKFCFMMSEDDKVYLGGLTREYFLVVNESCPYKEMMLRVLINKCMNEFIQKINTTDIWNIDLAKFGFVKNDDIFTCGCFDLKLPHDCRC